MTIEALAKQFRLRAVRDGYDKIIQGERGYLYIDAGEVCAMWVNALISLEALAGLGAKVWVGDPSEGARGRDAKVTGIPPENYKRAIRLVGAGKEEKTQ